MLKKILTFLLFPFLCYSQDALDLKDIHKIMEQIFSQHVNKKIMTGEIIANSFKVYLEQFDPDGIYLLQEEVDPFLKMDPAASEKAASEYKQDNYSIYAKINQVIQDAIRRARALRKEITQNPKSLFTEALNSSLKGESEEKITYPLNEQELKKRIQNSIIQFLQVELRHFGEKRISGYETQVIALYEKQIQAYENQYTFTDARGLPLSEKEKDNLFALHILKALAKSLDAHTAFLDNQEAYDMKIRLEKGFDGIGIAFQESPQGILVANVLRDSPAEKEGEVKAGDLLIEINGIKTGEISFEKAMQMIKEDKHDQPLHLVFKRMIQNTLPKVFDVTLRRETIVLDEDRVDVSAEKFGDGIIGRITLHSFYQNDKGITSEKDVRRAIKELKAQGNLRGLILDLRENSGGFLSQAVKVAGIFITNGIVVISKYSNGTEKIYRDMDNKDDYTGPLIVLTSRATASAAEIVAQALQDYGVALVVGDEQTYGKGTIQSQTVTDNKGGSFFKVTVGEYFTVSGKTPQGGGVKADIVVPGPLSHVHLGEEYLDQTLTTEDRIAPTYIDPLKDIDPTLRPWYLRYYVPTVQKKFDGWRDELPTLRKNSQQRIATNKNYQAFLKLINHKNAESLKEELSEKEESANRNFGSSDLQLIEAYNVLKDMVYLAPQVRVKEYVGAEPEYQSASH